MDESTAEPLVTPETLVAALEKWLGNRHTGYDYV